MEGFTIFSIVSGVIIFGYVLYSVFKEAPSFGEMREEDKKATLLFYPKPTDEPNRCRTLSEVALSSKRTDGYISLSEDVLLYKDINGKELMRIPYSEILDCKTGSSTRGPTGLSGMRYFITPYHYLYVYENNIPTEALLFGLTGPS